MTDYQRKKNNPYFLPKTLYRRVLSVIRDYDRVKSEVDNILFGSPERDNGAAGGRIGKPTEAAAIRLAQYESDLDAVNKALDRIPPEYQKAVFSNVAYGERFPSIAHYNTWLKWRQRFIYYCAQNLKLV